MTGRSAWGALPTPKKGDTRASPAMRPELKGCRWAFSLQRGSRGGALCVCVDGRVGEAS